MTNITQLELLYSQFINLTNEINKLIVEEDYETALSKVKDKDKLIKKLLLAKKTINFSDEELKKVNLIDKKISEENKKIIDSLKKLHSAVGTELEKIKHKIKINSAYETKQETNQGKLIDTFE